MENYPRSFDSFGPRSPDLSYPVTNSPQSVDDIPPGFKTIVPKNKVTIVPSKIVSKLYPCPIPQCEKGYSREDRLRAHIRSTLDSCHQTFWKELNISVCAKCGKILESPAGLKKHTKFSHPDGKQKEQISGTKKKARNARSMMVSPGNTLVAASTTGGDPDFSNLNAGLLRKLHYQPLNLEGGVSASNELEQPLTAGDEQIPAANQPQSMTGYRPAATSSISLEQQ